MPQPTDGFETGAVFTPRVDRYGMIAVRVCRYSVPARFIGRTVRVVLRSSDLVVFHGRTEIARHPRLTAKGAERVVLDHFLEVLLAKPGAMAGSKPWTRPAAKAGSPPSMKRSGLRRRQLEATPRAPNNWSTSFSCTGTSNTETWSPASDLLWRSAPTPPTSWPWRPERPLKPTAALPPWLSPGPHRPSREPSPARWSV